jgi:ABC-2 type transport system permease protein
MWSLIQIEVYKIFRRPRTYIAFAAIAALILTVQFGLKIDGKSYLDFMLAGISGTFDIQGNIINGYLICYIILQLLMIHVPLLVTLIAADIISGEANMGTLRLLLTKPYSRSQIVLAKFIATIFYTTLLLIWLALFALFISMAIFGTDDLFLLKSDYIVIIKNEDVLWRYAGAFCFATIAMITVAALGFLLSVFADNSIGPIVTTMSLIVFFTVISTLNIPLYNTIKPYLFITHMNNWKEFFDLKVNDANEAIAGTIQNPQRIITSAIVLVIHIVLFVGAAMFVFKRKDILS